ncbi:RNA-directed DNA polymerase, eukaryota [Tanacetum coccineum]
MLVDKLTKVNPTEQEENKTRNPPMPKTLSSFLMFNDLGEAGAKDTNNMNKDTKEDPSIDVPSRNVKKLGLFPRLFALDTMKDISVTGKLQSPLVSSFRRNVRGGIEEQQLEHLVALLDSVILSNSNDRWVSDLNGDGVFRVKDVRNLLDEFFLPRADIPTRWVKNIPIKVNIFAWKLALDRLPTRANLVQRNVVTESQSCPLCDAILEDTSHLFFNCSLARDVTRLLCRWWNLGVQSFSSYAEWLVWFNSVRLASNLKVLSFKLDVDQFLQFSALVTRNDYKSTYMSDTGNLVTAPTTTPVHLF